MEVQFQFFECLGQCSNNARDNLWDNFWGNFLNNFLGQFWGQFWGQFLDKEVLNVMFFSGTEVQFQEDPLAEIQVQKVAPVQPQRIPLRPAFVAITQR